MDELDVESPIAQAHLLARRADDQVLVGALAEAVKLLGRAAECYASAEQQCSIEETRLILPLLRADCLHRIETYKRLLTLGRGNTASPIRSRGVHDLPERVFRRALASAIVSRSPKRATDSGSREQSHISTARVTRPGDAKMVRPLVEANEDEPGDFWDLFDTLLNKIPNPVKQRMYTGDGIPPGSDLGSFFMVPNAAPAPTEASQLASPPSEAQFLQQRQLQIRQSLQQSQMLRQRLLRRPGASPLTSSSGATTPNKSGLSTFQQLQAEQQTCLQALEAGIEDREVETQTWQRLVSALNEQVRLLLLENAQLNQMATESEALRQSIMDFKRDAEAQKARLRQSMMMTSTNAVTISTAQQPQARGPSRWEVGELERLRKENERLKKENAHHMERWEHLKASAKKKRQGDRGVTPNLGEASVHQGMNEDGAASHHSTRAE